MKNYHSHLVGKSDIISGPPLQILLMNVYSFSSIFVTSISCTSAFKEHQIAMGCRSNNLEKKCSRSPLPAPPAPIPIPRICWHHPVSYLGTNIYHPQHLRGDSHTFTVLFQSSDEQDTFTLAKLTTSREVLFICYQ